MEAVGLGQSSGTAKLIKVQNISKFLKQAAFNRLNVQRW